MSDDEVAKYKAKLKLLKGKLVDTNVLISKFKAEQQERQKLQAEVEGLRKKEKDGMREVSALKAKLENMTTTEAANQRVAEAEASIQRHVTQIATLQVGAPARPPGRPPAETPAAPSSANTAPLLPPRYASQKEKERLESQLRSKRQDSQQERQAGAQAQEMSRLKAAKEAADAAKGAAEREKAILTSRLKESEAREQRLQAQLLQASTSAAQRSAEESAAATETQRGHAAGEQELRNRERAHEEAVKAHELTMQAKFEEFNKVYAKLQAQDKEHEQVKARQLAAAAKLDKRVQEAEQRRQQLNALQTQHEQQQQQLDSRAEQLKRREEEHRAAAAAASAVVPPPAKRRRGEVDGDGGDGPVAALLAQLGDLEQSQPAVASAAIVDLLESGVSAWLYSPCALQPMGGDRGAVSMQLSGCAAAALDELAARLSTVSWAEALLRHLALLVVGRGRDAQLPASTLQRDVLVAHLFSRCCRARDEPGRLRVAAFELARHRHKAEPALLAALCCSWPEAMGLGAAPGAAAMGLGEVLGALASRAPPQPQPHGEEGGSLNARARALLRAQGGEGWVGQPESVSTAMVDGLVARLGQAVAPEGGRTADGCHSVAAFLLSEQVLEWCCALELLATSLGWNWTAQQLLPRLMQLLSTETNLEAHTAVLCLVGRIGQVAPSSKGARWIRTNLSLVLDDADGGRKGQAAAFSLLEMDMAASPEATATEGEELKRLGAWLNAQSRDVPPSSVPRHVRARGKAVWKAFVAANKRDS